MNLVDNYPRRQTAMQAYDERLRTGKRRETIQQTQHFFTAMMMMMMMSILYSDAAASGGVTVV